MMIKRFEIYLVNMAPSLGSELRKVRPVVVVSSDLANSRLETVVVVPLTTSKHRYPTRFPFEFRKRKARMALDQIRVIDKSRLKKKLADLSEETARYLCERLQEMFIYQ